MLVTFKSRSSGDIVMFGDVATQLLKLMGQSGDVPGAVAEGDVQNALAALEAGLAARPDTGSQPSAGDIDEDDGSAPVSLQTRALPLIDMLKAADADNVAVMWEQQ